MPCPFRSRLFPLTSQLALYSLLSCFALPSASEAEDAWADYRRRSEELQAHTEAKFAAELRSAGLERPIKTEQGKAGRLDTTRSDEWFRSDEAARIAAAIRSYQHYDGGWSKNIDPSTAVRLPGQLFGAGKRNQSTLDNGATVPQIRFLARAYRVTGREADRAAVESGIAWVLAAQYPNGGWPQIYPLAGSYHDAITYNDGATVHALGLMRDVAAERPDFEWLDPDTLSRARAALTLGVQCILKSQVRVDGYLTAWCQQHDPRTLAPVAARAFEMVSLSSKESSDILDFLVTLNPTDPAILASMAGAADWLRAAAIKDSRIVRDAENGYALQPYPGADPVWARFYEIGSNRPIFGDRDGSVHYDIAAISPERRKGYAWYVTDPQSALRRYEKWLGKRQGN